MSVADLSLLAEHLGHWLADGRGWSKGKVHAVAALRELLSHESPIVREGAIYGACAYSPSTFDVELRRLAESDTSPGVRSAAAEQIEESAE